MRVLVTGHNGYIGSVMVPVLRASGHDIVGLDTFFFEDCLLGDAPDAVPAIRKDIRDMQVSDLEGFDAVVHLAALCNDPLGDLNQDWTYDINHHASVHLARLSREAGVRRFLYASSCSMYGAAGDEILNETAPLRPLTAYGLSPHLRADVVLNNLVCWAQTTGRIRIMSDGTPWRPIVHVQDISRAFAVALVAPRPAIHNEAFNVGSNEENYQVSELAEIVRGTVAGCTVEYAEGGGPDPRSYRVDFGKLGRVLPEFRPQWNASFGSKELYSALQDVNLTLEDFQGRRYIRLTQFKHLLDSGRLDGSLRWREASNV